VVLGREGAKGTFRGEPYDSFKKGWGETLLIFGHRGGAGFFSNIGIPDMTEEKKDKRAFYV